MATMLRRGDTALGRDKLSPMERLGIFAGLAAAPFVAYVIALLIHLYAAGGAWGPIRVPGNPYALTITVLAIAGAGWWFGIAAHHFADHRTLFIRRTLCWSARLMTWMFAATVAIGLYRWLLLAFILAGWTVAVTWGMARLDATRKEKERGDGEGKKLPWLEELSGWDGKVVDQERDHKGRLVRSVVRLKNTKGLTLDALQGLLKNVESYTGVMAGMSRVVGGERSNEAEATIMHRDPLDGFLPMRPLAHRGATIAEPVVFARYDDNCDVRCFLGGGRGFSASNYVFMGVSRSGKTVAENQLITDLGSRRGVVFLYLNQAKGKQDLRPVCPVVEVAIVAEDENDSLRQYATAFQHVKRMIMRRSQILGEYGIQEWSAKTCFDNPPQVKVNGDRVPMEPMPALVVHVGEADAILEDGRASDVAIFLASKGLSTGILTGWSLQRADANMMPTPLRYNLGTKWCFGTGDDVSAGMVLPESVIKAGADPEWGATRPGQHFFVGMGIETRDYTKRAKTEFIAPAVDEDDDFEDIKRAFADELLRRNKESAATTLSVLDRVTAEATRDQSGFVWWDLMAAATDRLRSQLGGDGPRKNTSQRQSQAPAATATTESQPATSQPMGEDMFGRNRNPEPRFVADEELTAIQEHGPDIRADVADVTEVEGVDLYPDDDPEMRRVDLDAPMESLSPGDDTSWEDDRPDAPDRATAILMFHEGMRTMAVDPALRADPADADARLLQIGDIVDRWTFKSRPWFYAIVKDTVAEGGGPGYTLVQREEYGLRPQVFSLKLKHAA